MQAEIALKFSPSGAPMRNAGVRCVFHGVFGAKSVSRVVLSLCVFLFGRPWALDRWWSSGAPLVVW